jgi:hypothetical protein
MTDFEDTIPEGTISICDVFEIVHQTIRSEPGKQANREGSHGRDQSRLRASDRLRKLLSQGALIALFWDPEKKSIQQISRRRWASMGTSLEAMSDQQLFAIASGVSPADVGAIEALVVFESGVTVVGGKGRTLFLNRKSFDEVMKDIGRGDGDRAAHQSAPTASSKAKPTQQLQILDISRQLWPNGCNERPARRNEMIISEFRRLGRPPPSDRSIQRALNSD